MAQFADLLEKSEDDVHRSRCETEGCCNGFAAPNISMTGQPQNLVVDTNRKNFGQYFALRDSPSEMRGVEKTIGFETGRAGKTTMLRDAAFGCPQHGGREWRSAARDA